MKKAVIILLSLINAFVFAQVDDAFEKGNAFYKDGNYEDAISQWESILNEDKHAAALYFNLGNAYYKLNQIGPSIYFYEKALQLSPNDRDIKNNLKFAQNQTIDVIEPLPKSVFSNWYHNTIGLFSFNGWAVITIVFVILFAVLFLFYYYAVHSSKKRLFFSASMVALFFGILAFTFSYIRHSGSINNKEAIIFSERVQVKNEPTNRSDAAFYLHEGTKVKIIDQDGDWYRIELIDGNDGWILKADLKEL